MRTVLIGPVLPIRGGIAQHTTMLRRALDPLCDLRTFSYSRQYPDWLYPGGNQTEEILTHYREAGVEYALDGRNPGSWLAVARQVRAWSPHRVILPWWTVYWAPMYLVMMAALRAPGNRITIIAHNVVDHESTLLKRLLTRVVLKRADRILVHNTASAAEVTGLLGPGRCVTVHPHPIYDQFPADEVGLPRRAELELLYFGFVRGYKGLDLLLKAVAGLEGRDWHLSIVGEFWHEEESRFRARIEELGLARRIELVPRYVSDREAAGYFGRADLVVLPYARSNGSGVLPLAYNYNTPVVVSDIGSLKEMVVEGRTGWCFEANRAGSLHQVLAARTAAEAAGMAPAIEELKSHWSWPSMARSLLEL